MITYLLTPDPERDVDEGLAAPLPPPPNNPDKPPDFLILLYTKNT